MKRKKYQSILEYAVLVAIVAGAFAAMRTYVSRAIQAHLKVIEEQVANDEEIEGMTVTGEHK